MSSDVVEASSVALPVGALNMGNGGGGMLLIRDADVLVFFTCENRYADSAALGGGDGVVLKTPLAYRVGGAA